MPFEAEDFHDLVRLLQQHPEWQEELRRLVLSRELFTVPAELRDLRVEMERSFSELAQRMSELADITRAHASRLDQIDERLDRLATTVAELSQTSTRHAQSLSELADITRAHAQSLARLERDSRAVRQHLGALSALVGAGAEVDAARVLMETLRGRGYEILGHPQSVTLDGEVDVALLVRDPSGRDIWILIEAKARLRPSDVRQWARKLQQVEIQARLRAAGVRAPVIAYAFGRVIYQGTEQAARDHGLGLLTPFGEVVQPTA